MVSKNATLSALMKSMDVDASMKELFNDLIDDITHKDQRISQLAEMRQMTIKVNELERYESKDCLFFKKLPIGANGSYLADIVAFIREMLHVQICEEDLKACHPLGRGANGNFLKIIANFLYNDQKGRAWKRKHFSRTTEIRPTTNQC